SLQRMRDGSAEERACEEYIPRGKQGHVLWLVPQRHKRRRSLVFKAQRLAFVHGLDDAGPLGADDQCDHATYVFPRVDIPRSVRYFNCIDVDCATCNHPAPAASPAGCDGW